MVGSNAVLQQQNQQMVSMMEKLLENKAAPTTPLAIPLPATDPYGDLVRDLSTFCYDDDDTTFKDWFNDRGSSLPDERKRNLLLDKLDRHAYKTHSDYVLPQEP
ncbi:unnamed protein product [Heligmosomoides polygyrus]|uniref:DUF7083 domain-containing protein n=1 Tax=Heligmosomoides polygyrus TaxID=6339 RepID=A0A183FV77_HELPZ|nr:unnamed protein product [Heligmosomoides polygyrus]